MVKKKDIQQVEAVARDFNMTDLAPLRELTSGVIGETCWRANLSYGDELTLYIGARIPYP